MDDLLRGPLGAERDRPAPDLTPRPRRGRAAALCACALGLALVAPGCGGDDEPQGTFASDTRAESRVLTWALPRLAGSFDPLAATSREAQLITRQVHEPLIATIRAPFGTGRSEPGLALSARGSVGDTVWTLALRRGVRFADGTPFDATAALANARRWLSDPRGAALLGDVTAVDAPRPGEIRFVTASPAPGFPRRLASPRLGVVSPEALDPITGEGAAFEAGAEETGTGPFDPAGTSDTSLELGRNSDWWGARLGLGPGLDGVVLVRAERKAGRLALLEVGQAQVATLGPAGLREAVSSPLVTRIGPREAAERSVRGLSTDGGTPQLSGVWLTTLGG